VEKKSLYIFVFLGESVQEQSSMIKENDCLYLKKFILKPKYSKSKEIIRTRLKKMEKLHFFSLFLLLLTLMSEGAKKLG